MDRINALKIRPLKGENEHFIIFFEAVYWIMGRGVKNEFLFNGSRDINHRWNNDGFLAGNHLALYSSVDV
jgi:hypothetical protein